MNVKYHKWLELMVANSYFPQSIFPAFKMVPFPATAQMFKNYNILMDKKENVVSLYVGSDANPFDVVVELKGMDTAYLQLISTDTSFYNYTDIAEHNENQVLFFKTVNTNNGISTLQKEEYITDNDLLNYRPKIFNVQLPEGEVEVSIKNEEEQLIWQQFVNGFEVKNYPVNLNAQREGVYTLWYNDQLQETFFCSGALLSNCIGIWCLDSASLLKKGSDMLSFSLNFNARAAHWQYEVILGKSRKIEVQQMDILGNQGETYEGPVEKELIGGQMASVYTSTSPLQLQYKLEKTPQLQLNYINDFSDRTQQLEIELPNPAAGQLGKYSTGTRQGSLYATSIVYV